MSYVDNFISNYGKILEEPHSFELDPTAPSSGSTMRESNHGLVRRYTAKTDDSYYDVGIGRPIGGYKGPLSLDGSISVVESASLARDIFAIRLVPGKTDLGVRYLPWEDNKTTFIRLLSTDKLFFTGPLQGCHIYVGRIGDAFYVSHANWNKDTSPAGNLMAKDTCAEVAKNYFDGMGVIDVGALRMSDYKPVNPMVPYNGFVFGIRTDTWRFYYHCTQHDGTKWSVAEKAKRFA
jgi:hypothetical protein